MAKQFEKIEKTGKADVAVDKMGKKDIADIIANSDVAASIANSDAPWRVPTKHNWEYKRLGDVCDFVGGGTPAKSNADYYEGNIPWATVRDMLNFKLTETELRITEEAVNNSATNILPAGMIVISTHVGLGKICELMQNTAINQDLKGVLFSDKSIDKYYFVYWYRSVADYIISKGRGATVKGVTLDFMRNLQIPVPAREVQERIVAELDKINEVIEDCRELVRNLDDLAQSLFYNFFGDPVTNPKGWVVKKFSEVFKLSSGDGLSAKQIEPGPFPVYGGNGIVGYHATSNLGGNNIIIGRVGALCGNVRLVKGDIFVTDNAFITTFKEILNDKFAEYLLTLLDLRQYAKAAAQPVISNSSLKNIQIPLPPLQLQQEFAKRIELIEFQKKVVEETIANLKTLLDSRMDYWFN